MKTTTFPRFARRPVLWLLTLLTAAAASHAAPIDQIYEYDALNRLTKAGADTYQHDAAGNLTQTTAVGSKKRFKKAAQ